MGIRNKISPGYAYYLTITVVEWIDIFSRPVYKHLIVDSINYCIANKGLKVYCWCLMSNHLHMVASAEEGSLSDILRDFKKFTSKALIEAIQEEAESRRLCPPAVQLALPGAGRDAEFVLVCRKE